MNSINSVWLKGYLATEPIVVTKPKSLFLTHFIIGCPKKSKLRYACKTNYFRICLRGTKAEAAAEYLHKGAIVEVFGTLEQNMELREPLDPEAPKSTVCDVYVDSINFGSHKVCIYKPSNDPAYPHEYTGGCGHNIDTGENDDWSSFAFCSKCGGVIHVEKGE